MDQTLAAMHILKMFADRDKERTAVSNILMMDENSTMLMLPAGYSKVLLSNEFEAKSGCGLIPLAAEPTKICTRGLKWNLGDFENRDFG